MGTIVDIESVEVKTASGVWPAELSLWRDGVEVPLTGLQVVVPDVAPPPDPPEWVKPVIGASVAKGGSSETLWATLESNVGHMLIRRTYDTTLPASFATSLARYDVANGQVSIWSWKPAVITFPTDTAAKNAFSAFVDTIPAGHETIITAYHEPEQEIAGGDWSIAQWGAMINTMATIIKSKNRPELKTAICLMGPWTFNTASEYSTWDWDNAVDWDLVDIVGIDPYRTTSGSTLSLERLLTWGNSGSSQSTVSMMDKIEQWEKPCSLMEWGAYNSTESSVATFITDAYAWMLEWNEAHPVTPIINALWFNQTLIGADTELTGVEQTAYAAIVADSKIPPT